MNNPNASRKLAVRPRAGCLPVLFLLAGLLAVVTPLHADNPPTYLFQWGSPGTGNGQFNEPGEVAIDSSTNVYVADQGNFRIEKFDSNGNYLTQWGGSGSGNGQFSLPAGIAVDSSNNVYVADYGNNRIEKFDSNGNYLTQWGSSGSGNGQFDEPEGVAVDRSNNVYVTDSENDRLEKFTSSGTYLAQWGSGGGGNGQFDNPEWVAVDISNNVYVTDLLNDRVEKFDGKGNYLTQWGSYGSGNGLFDFPLGIAVDSSNHVYVADDRNDRLEKFTSSGTYLAQWGSGGSGNGQLANPDGVAVDSSGNFIYVVDFGNYRIQVFVNNANIIPPVFISQPTTQAVLAGTTVTFSVGVVGGAPFAYQWNSNNVAVSGATNASFTLTDVNLSNSAAYSVLVTNTYGSTLSSNATLTVAPLIITHQPMDQFVAAGGNVTFSVGVIGAAPFAYQWNSNNAAVSGATNATFTLTNVSLSTSSSAYSVLVTNSYGSELSSSATLTVVPLLIKYLFSGSLTNITLNPGTYIITAYGAPGGGYGGYGGLGAEMSAEFNFSSSTNLTLLVGGGGGTGTGGFYTYGGGGGGGSFVVEGSTPLVIAGGGGGGGTVPFTGYVVSEDGNSYVGGVGGTGTIGGNGGPNYGGSGGGGAGGYYGNGGSGGAGYGGDDGGGGGYGGGGGGYGGGYSFENDGYGGAGQGMADDGGYGGGGGGGGSVVFIDGLSTIEGGGGGGGGYSGGGGGGGYGGGGGGGSIIDSSAITNLAELSGIASPGDPINGEIIIITLPPPSLAITTGAAFGFTNGVFGFNVIGPSGSNVVIQASTDLKTWIPLQTNLLGSGLLYFSDAQSATNTRRFYRAQLSP